MSERQSSELVLALYPSARGLAFVIFEGPLSPIDWGVKAVRGRHDRITVLFEMAKSLIERYQPEIVVLQGHRKGNRRADHARRLEQMILTCAAGQNAEAHRYTREDVRNCFRQSGAITRYEIAHAIAAHIPALSHRLPPMKKLWQSEDGRMGLFDAASLALTYFLSLIHI